MARKVFQREEIEALLAGLIIYGTGGGGAELRGRYLINNDIDLCRTLEMVDLEDIKDDAFVCSGGNMGSVKASVGVDFKNQVQDWEKDFPLLKSLKMMEKIKGKKLDYIVPFETGAGNTPIILTAAARMGIPMLNADLVGRAAPETQMTSLIGHGISLYPMCLIDDSNNSFIVMDSKEPTYGDEVGRILIEKGGRFGANTHYPMTGKEAKAYCVPKSISKALELGLAVIEANEKKKDGVEVVRDYVGGIELFKGTIQEHRGEDKGGFYISNFIVKGVDSYRGKMAKMVVKNELMLLEIDGELRLMFPDYGFMLYPETGQGILSVDLKPKLDIVILGAPCHPLIRECMYTKDGKKSFGAKRYGYPELEYYPFEDLNNIRYIGC